MAMYTSMRKSTSKPTLATAHGSFGWKWSSKAISSGTTTATKATPSMTSSRHSSCGVECGTRTSALRCPSVSDHTVHGAASRQHAHEAIEKAREAARGGGVRGDRGGGAFERVAAAAVDSGAAATAETAAREEHLRSTWCR